MKDESELIQLILAGDEAAKVRFYRDHQKRLYPIAVHFLGYRDPEAEDVVQETFLIALVKLKDFEPRSTLYTWLAHITINLCFDRLRKRRRQLATQAEDMEHLAAGLSVEDHEKRGRDAEHAALVDQVRRTVEQLDPKCRKVVGLRDLKGTPYADIGKQMRIPIGTVMSRLARCRELLKQMFLGTIRGENHDR